MNKRSVLTTPNPHRVLVVEDEVDIRLTLDYNLRKEGYVTLLAGTGEEALEILDNEPLPDLILLDWMLPGMKGTHVCRQIRASDLPRIPIMMLTAKSTSSDRKKCFQAGADDFITKPFLLEDLLSRIRQQLNAEPASP